MSSNYRIHCSNGQTCLLGARSQGNAGCDCVCDICTGIANVPVPPTQEEINKMKAEHRAQGCSDCDIIDRKGMAPSFAGSRRCESGSIASGGNNSHCGCDICF